jgi:FtsZ-interacting cell division protein ZipA
MDSTALIILVVVVVIALAVVGLVVARGTKKREAARAQAEELRSDPVASGAGVHDANLEAQRAAEEAERLRREAEQAEAQARKAEQGVTVEQARQEDQLRQADRVDPDVNPKADDYDPSQPAAGPVAPPEQPDTRTDPDQGVATLGDEPRQESPPRR